MSRSPSIRTGLTSEEIKQDFLENLRCGLGRAERFATRYDQYYALAFAEMAMAERVKQAANDLRANNKTMFAS